MTIFRDLKHGAANPGRILATALLTVAACLSSPAASAQQGYLVQGIFDAELFDTDTDSPLLTRNEGDPAALGRLQLWTAFQLTPALQLYAQGEVVSDNFEGYRETGTELDQFALRYSRQSRPWFSIEAGKILSPLAAYSERQLSTRNPLITQPYLYTRGYPWGAKLAGSGDWFDYQLAWIAPEGGGEDYNYVKPDRTFRPALSFGVTPFTGLRFGLTWTMGTYLNSDIGNYLPDGRQWRDYSRETRGADFQFSRGYLEFSGQFLQTRQEVPYRRRNTEDLTYFLELKYTWTPRLYGALRYQGVEATYIDYPGYGYWRTSTDKFSVLEVGLGYRFSPELLVKAAYHTDRWDAAGYGYGKNARGHALGLQLSWFFDLTSLFGEKP